MVTFERLEQFMDFLLGDQVAYDERESGASGISPDGWPKAKAPLNRKVGGPDCCHICHKRTPRGRPCVKCLERIGRRVGEGLPAFEESSRYGRTA